MSITYALINNMNALREPLLGLRGGGDPGSAQNGKIEGPAQKIIVGNGLIANQNQDLTTSSVLDGARLLRWCYERDQFQVSDS
jgi:hypothetical protein